MVLSYRVRETLAGQLSSSRSIVLFVIDHRSASRIARSDHFVFFSLRYAYRKQKRRIRDEVSILNAWTWQEGIVESFVPAMKSPRDPKCS